MNSSTKTLPTTSNRPNFNPCENMVTFIIKNWFGGVRAEMARQMNWKATMLQRREEAGHFTAHQQREILQKSDDLGWGIKPAHFFPERQADIMDAAQ